MAPALHNLPPSHLPLCRSDKEELHLYSVSTDNLHFHPALFKPAVLPPLGSVSISVVFLPRTLGQVSGTLVMKVIEPASLLPCLPLPCCGAAHAVRGR